eukprot:TRINITY_DN49_c0_g2_i1.p1 TRINITY_DN49_c0_g2~~TRINITY_DN49_c0_g2_i1.p1  ORF type:complete len:225 (+),score=83.53 TRINITY_DN49_c0_g2_i1:15-689(+)
MKVFFLTLLLVGLTFAVAPFKGRRGAGKEMEQLTWTTELLREGELSTPHFLSNPSYKPLVGEVDPTVIINTAKEVWKFIEDNKPVVHTNSTYADGIPKGITSWDQLENWSRPKHQTWLIKATNTFGMEILHFEFTIQFVYGGSYNGTGKYITDATILMSRLEVTWGFTFDADVSVSKVHNRGTKAEPIASMTINLHHTLDSTVKHIEGTESFYLDGEGNMENAN